MRHDALSVSTFILAGALVFASIPAAHSTQVIEDKQFLIGIEQGYSLYRDRARYPLIAPLTWIDTACLERGSELEADIVNSFFELTSFVTGRGARIEMVSSVKDCPLGSDLTIIFSRSLEEADLKIALVNERFGAAHRFDKPSSEESVGLASIDIVSKSALVVVNLEGDVPERWNTAILLQELFQAYLGGNDVPWQTEYFSLLHEVDPYPDETGPAPFSRAWKEAKFRVNPTGLCPVDVFAMAAISKYLSNANVEMTGPTSRGLINFSWDRKDSIRRDVEKVGSDLVRFSRILDVTCW
jgi:hypothetical protein